MKNITTALTRTCDLYLRPTEKGLLELGMHTYLCQKSATEAGRLYLRFPGATRGVVERLPDGTITSIRLNEGTAINGIMACYEPGIREAVAAFVGQNVYEEAKDDG